MKKIILKNRILSIALILVSLFAIGGVARANSSFVDVLAEKVADRILGSVQSFGALVTETPTNLDDDEWTAFNDVYADDVEIEDDLWVGGDASVTGALSATGDLTVSGDDFSFGGISIKAVTGSCADATTTPIAVANPFATGSSTVTFLQIDHPDTATTTIAYDCGVAANQFTSSDTLIDGYSVATTTYGYVAQDYGTNGRATDTQGDNEYLTCTITPEIAGGVTDGGNAYTCTYKAVFRQ